MRGLPKYVTRDTDRHGNVRHYFRRYGRRIRIAGVPGSDEFALEIVAAQAALAPSTNKKVSSFVYFIRYGKRIKIGVCANVKARLRQLSTGIPGKANVHYVTPGGVALERDLHTRFAEDRVSGEWFQFSKPIREWIDQDRRRREIERGVNVTGTSPVAPSLSHFSSSQKGH